MLQLTMDDIEGKIIKNYEIAPGYRLLKIRLSRSMDQMVPGQFVMLKVPDSEVFLRRPFSIYGYSRETLSLMYKVIGKGTESLSKATGNERVSVLCPLGKGFTIQKRDAYVIVAGGIGIAGLHALIQKLGKRATIFFGCNNKAELPLMGSAADLNPYVSTLDGSYGFRGNVVQLIANHMKTIEKKDVEVFTCGPESMLKSLKKLLEKKRIPCQASFEERMACGLGLCFGCVKKTVDEEEPYKRVCKEGPVFDLWQVCL
jgi:dihydroorotate dehydrogenase electron transfer subunit